MPLALILLLVGVSVLIIAVMLRRALPRPVLIGLPYSHYVELARWALQQPTADHVPRPFREIKVSVGPHLAIVGAYRILFSGLSSTSSFPGSDTRQPWYLAPLFGFAMLRRLTGVPVFVSADGECLPDSWSILRFCGYSIDHKLAKRWDEQLGPAVRKVGYYFIFQLPGVYRGLQSCGALQMALFDAMELLFQTSRWIMKPMMGIRPEQIPAATATIRVAFADASAVLECYPYLADGNGGPDFGGADLAFSALSGWALQPIPQYHNGECWLPPSELLHAHSEYRALSQELIATRAGRHVLRCYKEHRTPSTCSTDDDDTLPKIKSS